MKHHVMIGEKARTEVVTALNAIGEAVGSTLGPGGRVFAYDRYGPDMRLQATFSKDGLTVLRSLGFDHPAWDAVLQYAKQAAAHSVLASGDGTTSTIVIAAAVARAVINSATEMPPQAFARMIEQQAAEAVEAIKSEAITGDEAVRLVALTSTNGDQELADITIEAIQKSSAFGTIIAEKNPAGKDRYRIVTQDGYSHCQGYEYNNTLAWSASDKAASNEPIEWAKPLVAIFNGNLMAEHQIDPILAAWNELLQAGETRSLVVVCYDMSDAVANKLLVVNRTVARQGVGVFVVKPRLSSEINCGLHVIRDIAAFSGIAESAIIDGGNYKVVDKGFFGTCDKIKITPTNTVFMGRASNHWVEKRVQQNMNIVAEARIHHDREATARRNAQLTEGLVKVEVGAGLMPDLQERADRLDDATKAAQACIRAGALPGCGASYIRAAELAAVGPELKEALHTIHNQIMTNRGLDPYTAFEKGQTANITKDGAELGYCMDVKVMDATDTVCAVIRNGVELGVKVATLGGYSFRTGPQDDAALEGY